MKIRYILLSVFSLVSMFLGTGLQPAFAQTDKEPSAYQNVRVWLYPEYDDPRLLVMMQGKIVGAEPPVNVRFLVPTSAEMYSAGSIDAQGVYSGGPPNRKASQTAGYDEISYELKTNTFRVEYYVDAIKGRPDNKISWDFMRLYPINDLIVIVQQPRNSSEFAVAQPGGTTLSENGFNTLQYSFKNLDVATPVHFDVSYFKSDTTTSISQSNPPPAAGGGAGSAAADPTLIISLVIGLIVIVAAAFMLLGRAGRKGKPVRARASGTSRPIRSTSSRFCTQCGSANDAKARFCQQCGAKLRGS